MFCSQIDKFLYICTSKALVNKLEKYPSKTVPKIIALNGSGENSK